MKKLLVTTYPPDSGLNSHSANTARSPGDQHLNSIESMTFAGGANATTRTPGEIASFDTSA